MKNWLIMALVSAALVGLFGCAHTSGYTVKTPNGTITMSLDKALAQAASADEVLNLWQQYQMKSTRSAQDYAKIAERLAFFGDGFQKLQQDTETIQPNYDFSGFNDADAQYNLALKHYKGEGVQQDYVKAVKWFAKAAEQGNASAQFSLAYMYAEGEGVQQDYTQAVKWYTKAAEQGNASAQNNLASMYQEGDVVQQDYAEAVKWYMKAAEQGDANAQRNLAYMYQKGNGVQQDYEAAMKWYMKAAEQGNPWAQLSLGMMYHSGEGVQQDFAEAVTWFAKAAKQGNVEIQRNLVEELQRWLKESRESLIRKVGGRLDGKSAEQVKELIDEWMEISSLVEERWGWQAYNVARDCGVDVDEFRSAGYFYKTFGQPVRKQLTSSPVTNIFGFLVDHYYYYFYYQCKDGTVQLEIDADSLSEKNIVLVSKMNIF